MIQTIPYRISRIETVQFAVFPENYVNGEDARVNTNCDFNVRSNLKQVRNVISVNYTQDEKLLLVIELVCFYNIAAEGVNAIREEGKIPKEFLQYMGAISVGTIRGVIHAKTEGTVLNPIVMPPINLKEMIRSDMLLSDIPSDNQENKDVIHRCQSFGRPETI